MTTRRRLLASAILFGGLAAFHFAFYFWFLIVNDYAWCAFNLACCFFAGWQYVLAIRKLESESIGRDVRGWGR
jgi:hypothetical protein